MKLERIGYAIAVVLVIPFMGTLATVSSDDDGHLDPNGAAAPVVTPTPSSSATGQTTGTGSAGGLPSEPSVPIHPLAAPTGTAGQTSATPGQTAPGSGESQDDKECYENMLLYARVMELVRERYVDDKKTTYSALTKAALKGMLSSLDPHSQFLDENGFQDLQKVTKGAYSGIGITLGMKNGWMVVTQILQGSPSERAGILPGDRLISVEGKATDRLVLADVDELLKGEPGEMVSLAFERPRTGAPEGGNAYKVDVMRETIRVRSIKDVKILPSDIAGPNLRIGYIRIEEFEEKTSEELDSALADLQGKGMQGLVIDLRNNPGGLLDVAVDVASKFLPGGSVVVTTKGKTPDQLRQYVTRSAGSQLNYPIVLLVNGYTASAAEIMAGAMKDLNRAVIVGETTFGKGSVQTVEPLGHGLGIRLTTAKYYTPSNRSIQELGVSPDVPVVMSDEDERRLALVESERSLNPDEQIEVSTFKDAPLIRAIAAIRTLLKTEGQPGGLSTAELKR